MPAVIEDLSGTDEEAPEQAGGEQPADGEGGAGETGEQPADTGAEAGEAAGAAAAGDESDLIVTLGEESPPSEQHEESRAPEWVRELRKTNRELQRQNRELQDKLKATEPAARATEVGQKPTLEGCDFDGERFESELTAWHERKRQADSERQEREQAEQKAQADWKAKLDAYGTAKAALKVRDFDDAEDAIKATLNVTQQGVILQGAERPELLVYALGKNPAKAKELAAITDPVKFAFAVAKLESQLKVQPRKAPPLPERPVRGSAPSSGAVDSQLERLRADAERTGDYTKVAEYRRQQRMKQAA